ncbi:MAG TPA: hypothetical protein VEB21_15935 [Terriglobales bacterium]|nr:hypothetical protein [Terriglobales bacterium]
MKRCAWGRQVCLLGCLALLSVATADSVAAGDKRQVIRPKDGSDSKFEIIEDGDEVGSVRRDHDSKRRFEVLDEDGDVEQVIKRDKHNRHTYRVYDDHPIHPKQVGTVKRQDDDHDRYDIEDAHGNKIGEMRKRKAERHRGEYEIRYE